jgi:hypothetical protein
MTERLDRDAETSGTSSSRAFAELSTPATSELTTRTRSRAAERFNTPLQAEAPFDAVLSSIAEENDYRSRRRSTSLPRRASGDPNFDDGSDPTGNQHYQSYRHTWKSVDKVIFEKTSTSYIDMLLKDKISNKNCFKKWEVYHGNK